MSWVVGRGSRNGRAGWVVYREGERDVSDPVFPTRKAAEAFASEKNSKRRGRSLTAEERRANGQALLAGIWLPSPLVQSLDAECERRGAPRTELVREALENLLAR